MNLRIAIARVRESLTWHYKATRKPLLIVSSNLGPVTRMKPKLASPLLTTPPRQREDIEPQQIKLETAFSTMQIFSCTWTRSREIPVTGLRP
ncbi:hypothetical protein TNCV_3611021 [Trichonephila clavipes]|nr:hypothetical protein TNCV_3611021 [Trichonephila clavipes]